MIPQPQFIKHVLTFPPLQAVPANLFPQETAYWETPAPITLPADLTQRAELLDSIPGVGPAARAQSLAFMGLNPNLDASGTCINVRTRISKTGAASLTCFFYLPALVAMKHDPLRPTFASGLHMQATKGRGSFGHPCVSMIHIV